MYDELGVSPETAEWLQARAEERLRVKEEYGQLFSEVATIFFEHDPLGVNYETNTDEYDGEAGSILARIKEAESVSDIRRIVYEELAAWFHKDMVGKEERYDALANEIWVAWQRSRRKRSPSS